MFGADIGSLTESNLAKTGKKKDAKAAAEEEAKRLEQMKLEKQYQPPQSYMDKYKDPTVFNSEYQKYVQHLENESESDSQ